MAAITREDGILALGEICHLLRDGKDTILPLLVAIHLENIHTLVLETDAKFLQYLALHDGALGCQHLAACWGAWRLGLHLQGRLRLEQRRLQGITRSCCT